jgi:hypothetical protein
LGLTGFCTWPQTFDEQCSVVYQSRMSSEPISDEEAIVRYDRYVTEFLEPYNICPWARRAREAGRLHRAVLRGAHPTRQDCVSALLAIHALPADRMDVAGLILPDVAWDHWTFGRFVSDVREMFVCQTGHEYYLVVMHPELPLSLHNADVAVAFMRRTPHPTIQVARASVIMDARKGAGPLGAVSATVGSAALATIKTHGAERMEKLLHDIRHGIPRGS